MGAATSGPQHGFPFQRSILGEGSREEINLLLTTDAGALKAIRNNQPFPLGPGGALALGGIQFDWNSSGPVRFAAPGGDLDLDISVGGKSGGGVYRDSNAAFEAAGLVDGFKLPANADDEFLVLTTGYKASGTLSPSFPIGAIVTAGVGWSGSREGATAVVRRIAASTGAGKAITDATASWRLPRHIQKASDLPVGTWVAARGSGSLSVQLMARAGYTVHFLRQLNLLSMSRPLNARLAAALTATAGLSLNDDYVIVAGRESDAPVIRLRIFRASKQTRSAGIDLSLGLKFGKVPSKAGSFVNLMLGIHGLQVLSDLKAVRDWKGQSGMLAQTPARLDDSTAAELLATAGGTDSPTRMAAALDVWSKLPDKTRAALWESMENGVVNPALPPFLKTLATADGPAVTNAISEALAADPSQQSAELTWLSSLSDSGNILLLMQNPDRVRESAAASLKILDDGIIPRLRKFIESKLDLAQVTKANGQADFGKISKWLLVRLGDFLDRKIELGDLAELKLAITGLQKAEPTVASKAQSAFSQLLRANVAAKYQSSTRKSALLDADFNLDEPVAAQAFRDLMDKGQFDKMVTERIPGVTLHYATLTHELARSADIQLHLPFFDSKRENVNETIARLQVEESAGRVLTYELDSKDHAAASGRFRSELALLCRASVNNGKLDLSGLADATVAYQSRQVQKAASITDLKMRTQSFLRDQIGGDFADGAAAADLYAELESYGGLGDVALQFQVALPGTVLGGWLKQRNKDERKQAARAVSKSLQRGLKVLIPQLYLADDLSRLEQNDTIAALLVWSAIPPSTSISFDGQGIQAWDGTSDVYWDYVDDNLRNAVIRDSRTVTALQGLLAQAAARWRAAGDEGQAKYFDAGQVGSFLQKAAAKPGSDLLESLLYTEARMVRGAQKALEDLRDCWQNAATAPSETLQALAEFGADLSTTFNKRLSIFSSPEALRTFNSFLLAEASAALAPEAEVVQRRAAMTLFFLRDKHTLSPDEFLSGTIPPADQVRFARVLVNS